MHPREHIGFLFDLVIRGELRIKPLSHGLDSLCVEIIQNNYTRYRRLWDNLINELTRKYDWKESNGCTDTYKTNYIAALQEAKDTITFWDSLSRLFHEDNENANAIKRTLPESRLIIVDNSDDGRKGKEHHTNHKKGKAIRFKSKGSNDTGDNRLLAGHSGTSKKTPPPPQSVPVGVSLSHKRGAAAKIARFGYTIEFFDPNIDEVREYGGFIDAKPGITSTELYTMILSNFVTVLIQFYDYQQITNALLLQLQNGITIKSAELI